MDNSNWCVRCAAHTDWKPDGAGLLACVRCGNQNRWMPRQPLSDFGKAEHDLDTTGRRLRPGS